MVKWLKDDNGNRCSVEYWGSEEKAQEALDSLVDCGNCTDCYRCSDCSDCSGCSRCFRCSDCYYCYACAGCYACSDCSRCYGCYDCYACAGCVRCSDCYRCVRCSDCSDCSRCSGVNAKKGKPLPVPKIKDLHKKVYAAASKPNALKMTHWHTCKKTHCRAGWVVTLAGEKGKALEKKFGSVIAAMMIYDKSCPNFKINPCRFFESNKDALKDMRKLAK